MSEKTVTIQVVHATKVGLGWYRRAFRREAGTAMLLSAGCGLLVGFIVWLWQGAVQ